MDEQAKDRTDQGPPPSPPMRHFGEAPVHADPEPSGGVSAAKSFWLSSFSVGIIVVLTVFLSRNNRLESIESLVKDVDANATAETITTMATVAFWGTTGLFVVVMAVEALLLRGMLGRKRWARNALLLMVPVHAVVSLIAEAFLAYSSATDNVVASFAPEAEGAWTRWLLTIQLGLIVCASIASLWPGTRKWFAPHA